MKAETIQTEKMRIKKIKVLKSLLFAVLLSLTLGYSKFAIVNHSDIPFYGHFKEIPATAITPKGWLRKYLINQKEGLTGHLENAGYPFNTVGWAADSIPRNRSVEKWWPYEQTAYWIDGMLRCGLLLNDTTLMNKARKSIYYVLNHPDGTGFLGPRFMKPNYERDRWAYVIFFRAWMEEYAATKNPKLLEAIKNHYLGDRFPHTGNRESVNDEIILWAYAKSGDTALLHFAQEIYKNSNELNKKTAVSDVSFLKDSAAAGEHGVTFLEKSKLGAILYMNTGNSAYLEPSIAAYKKLDKYHMLIDGVNVSSEHLEKVTSQESAEICDISDYTWNIGYLLMATGNAAYADKIERAAFNAAPASVTKDFKALQYFSAPNQVIAAKGSFIRGGGDQMRYAPNPGTECCPGNVNRMMPNYAIHSWMTDGKTGIVASTYAPSSVTYPVGKNQVPVTIDEETQYPFSDNINFSIHLKERTEFTFYVRIPEWCSHPKILINGQDVKLSLKPGTYVPLHKVFKNGDQVKVILPSEFKLTKGTENGISVERGPLLYALKIKEDWKIDTKDRRSTKDFPAYELFANSPWNYALSLNAANLKKQITVIEHPYSDDPWSIENAPIELKVPARKVNGWGLLHKTEMVFENWVVERDEKGKVKKWVNTGQTKQKGNWTFTPALPDPDLLKNGLDKKEEIISLVPYGCTKLRITIFPKAGK